jgi:type III restriction enzyme
VRFKLKEYQNQAVRDVLIHLSDARDDYREKQRKIAFALSAIMGAGKTVMAAAVLEALFEGSEEFDAPGDQTAAVLWVTDDPNLNEQTRYRIMEASDRLDATRLVVIDESFHQPTFDAGLVYFLNRQKLTGKTYITHSDKRTITLWETIENTIEDADRTLYLVLDEAHRGMRPITRRADDEEQRSTTVLRLVNGFESVPPAPIVWGISATVERFTVAMKDAKDRITLPNVQVENAAVQASGLLKDTVVLDLPDETGSFATTLAREAAVAVRQMSELWEQYVEREGLPDAVHPLLVVQVPNKPSAADVTALLDAIYEAWSDLDDSALANVFGEHADLAFGSHDVPYIAPQDVQEAAHVRVLLAKDAISTGWDCPRAEALVSLRPAKDRTHITQLLGRLIRTPLARRIESDERLNSVTCFLPHFDLSTAQDVAEVMTSGKDEPDEGGVPTGRRVLIDPETMLRNSSLPDEVAECLAGLPSVSAPKTPAKPVKRLLSLAAELALDELSADPSTEALNAMYSVLDGQAAQHKKALEKQVDDILTADIRRLTANRITGTTTEATRQVAADERSVADAFRIASRAFGAAVANGYVKKLADSDGDDADIFNLKAKVAALAVVAGVVDHLEDAADKRVDAWMASFHADIKALNEDRRAAYDEIRLQARDPQEIEVTVPASRIEMTNAMDGDQKTPLPTRKGHFLSNDNGEYPVGKLGTWELQVLDTEMSRTNAVAWYRNPSSASKDAIQVPWHDGQRWKSMQPDFVFFATRKNGTLGASIVDPHGHHLADALGKLHGLAEFAERYASRFLRIEAVSKNGKGDLGSYPKDSLVLLDLTNSSVREAVLKAKRPEDAYAAAGQLYELTA